MMGHDEDKSDVGCAGVTAIGEMRDRLLLADLGLIVDDPTSRPC